MKTIKQLSEELKISKEAIYKKTKHPRLKEKLKPHIIKVDNVTHFDDAGEQIIIQSLNRERQQAIEQIVTVDKEECTIVENQPHLDELVTLLQDQVKTKDIQLEMQNGHISQLISELGRNQFLLKTEQFKNLIQLQSECAATDEAQEEGQDEQTQENKSFWQKLFKKAK